MGNPIILTSPEDLEQLITKAVDSCLSKISIPAGNTAAPEIINSEELCSRLDITTPTLARMRKKKLIPFLQLGTAIRYDFHSVVKALEQKNSMRNPTK